MTFTLGKLPLLWFMPRAAWEFSDLVLSYYFLNQSLSWQVVVGMALIVSGVTLVNLYAKMPH